MYWFTISVWAWTCLSFHTARPINLMCRAGLRAIIDEKRTPESFHLSMTYCAADYFSILLHPQKIQLLTLYLKKVSFGQPARQESDKNKIVTIHWKNHSIPRDSCFFSGCVFFSSSIMELQKKCSLASPCREVLEQSHVCLVGTGGHRRLWINGIFGFLISGFGWSPRRLFKSARYINIGLLRSLRGQHGWCRWWGYIHEEQCGYRRFSAPYIKRRRKKTSEMGVGGILIWTPLAMA